MKRFFTGFLVAALAIGTSPQGVMTLSFDVSSALARSNTAGGFTGNNRAGARPAGGARTRPATGVRPPSNSRPPTTKPVNATRPAAGTRPSTGARPPNPSATRPATPSTKPAVTRPESVRPPGARPPGNGIRPPNVGRPPGAKPAHLPVVRPPGYRPPHVRPPNWRPPYHRPPYYRPPHYRWGHYHYHSSWGWFFTAAIVGSTLVYVANLPEDKECQKITDNGETLYLCDDVLYRSTYYQDERVYEIVSDPPDVTEPISVFGLALTDPMTRGETVRDLQMRLNAAGYDAGSPDGICGSSTETALMWFQYDNELEPTGIVDVETAVLLGYESPQGAGASATDTGATGAESEDTQD